MLKLGVNTVLFKKYDVATALKAIKLAGYDGAELSCIQGMCEHLVLDAWQTQAPLVRAAAKEAGVQLLSMEVASLDEDRLTKAFEAAAWLGIPVVNVGPNGKSNVGEDLNTCIDTLRKRAELAAKHGVKVCVKAHVGASIFSTATTKTAMAAIDLPSFAIDMDPSHVYRAGENPELALPQVLARTRHIHIRDCKGRGPSPGEPMNQACGRGEIDLFGYFNVMVTGGYDGPVCLEVIGAGEVELGRREAVPPMFTSPPSRDRARLMAE